jgi:hypothetical protein
MVLALPLTCPYDVSGNGAAPLSRWHGLQFLKIIGAICSAKVGLSGTPSFGLLLQFASNKPAKSPTKTKQTRILLQR